MDMTDSFKALQAAAFEKLIAIEEKRHGRQLRADERLNIWREKVDGLDGAELFKIVPNFTTAETITATTKITDAEAAAWITENRSFLNPAAKMALARQIVSDNAFPVPEAPRPPRAEERQKLKAEHARKMREERAALAKKFGHA